MPRMGLLVTIALLAISSLFFAYRAFDCGVTITYHRATIDNLREDSRVLARIALTLARVPTASEADVESALREAFAGHLVKREGDKLFVEQVALRFQNGRLTTILTMDQLEQRVAVGG